MTTTTSAHTDASASCPANSTSKITFHRGQTFPPEVVHMIMENLLPESLVKCALANREFNKMATPLAWRFHSDPQTRRKNLGTGYRRSVEKYAHHIRSITIRFEDTLEFFCPGVSTSKVNSSQKPAHPINLPDLRELELMVSFRRNDRHSPPDYPHIITWVKASLVSLHVLRIWNMIPPELAVAIAHTQELRLTDILLRTQLSVSQATLFLRELPSHVQSLDLHTISGHHRNMTDDDNRPFTTNHHVLRTLQLNTDSCPDSVYDRFLVPFLATCTSNLKSFRSVCPKPLFNVNVQMALEKIGIQAETFTERDMENEKAEDKEIASKVHMFTCLEMVFMSNFRNVGPRTVETLIALPETLCVLELPNYGCITSKDVVLILSSLKRLESFSVRGPMPSFRQILLDGRDPPPCKLFLSAADVLNIKWPTTSLKVFSCPIQVPRLASHVPEEYRIADLTCEDEGECHTIQTQVLRRLAEQTNLTSLNFSTHIWTSTQWYSLEMTRSSGLEELEKLTKLECLIIFDFNHKMGSRDFRWVAETWNEPHFNFRSY